MTRTRPRPALIHQHHQHHTRSTTTSTHHNRQLSTPDAPMRAYLSTSSSPSNTAPPAPACSAVLRCPSPAPPAPSGLPPGAATRPAPLARCGTPASRAQEEAAPRRPRLRAAHCSMQGILGRHAPAPATHTAALALKTRPLHRTSQLQTSQPRPGCLVPLPRTCQGTPIATPTTTVPVAAQERAGDSDPDGPLRPTPPSRRASKQLLQAGLARRSARHT